MQGNPSQRFVTPRGYQATILGLLLAYGTLYLGFELDFAHVAAILATCQATQWLCTRWVGLGAFDPRSALISSLSLCLLGRSDSLLLLCLAGAVAIASKFALRVRDRHIFNPTAFGLVVLMIATRGEVWVSPGQWGAETFYLFSLACLGGLVVNRSSRIDVTYAFLGFHLLIVFGRAMWLGDPWTVPLHGIQNGSLLLFAFFMISDPKTIPNARIGRVAFAAVVAVIAAYLRFVHWQMDALIWALVGVSCATPLIDLVFRGENFNWRADVRPAPSQLIPGGSR